MDACKSMRVCFDSLCFSSMQQQQLADEEDATTEFTSASTSAAPVEQPTSFATEQPVSNMGNIQAIIQEKDIKIVKLNTELGYSQDESRELREELNYRKEETQELLQRKDMIISNLEAQLNSTKEDAQQLLLRKDQRIAELEQQLLRCTSEILELRSQLDKFLSVLPFKSPLKPEKLRPRKQRAQGISAEPPLEEPALLVTVEKSDRLVPRAFIITGSYIDNILFIRDLCIVHIY